METDDAVLFTDVHSELAQVLTSFNNQNIGDIKNTLLKLMYVCMHMYACMYVCTYIYRL